MLTTLGAAPLASPTFTGDPKAPTPAPGDSDTSIATTAFVSAAVAASGYAPLSSPTFTGDPKAPTPTAGDNDTSIATTAFVTAAVAAAGGGGGSVSQPQGRLTLQTATPVMTTTQSAKTTIYYTPYVGNQIPLGDGVSAFTMTTFSELSVATTDTTKSPAAVGASQVLDWFVWLDGSTLRLSHGPAWTNDTTRSSGTQLTRVNGIWWNNQSITNGPAAGRGTYVGTTRSNASSQLDWIMGGVGVGGVAGFFGVWNAYNRRLVATRSSDSTASWTYSSSTWRSANASDNMRASFVTGLAEDAFLARYQLRVATGGGGIVTTGIGLDVTNAITDGAVGVVGLNMDVAVPAILFGQPILGTHFIQAVERVSGGSPSFYGNASEPANQPNSLTLEAWM
jgi:hypothetical protein